MTERMPPDDRELEQYLKGDSPLSRRYRDASQESAPPELDEAILARARAELRRKPAGINRYLAPVALAASLVLGVNLAWNVYQAQPVPGEAPVLADRDSRHEGFVQSPPPLAAAPATPPAAVPEPAPQAERKARAAETTADAAQPDGEGAAAGAMATRETELAAREQDSLRKAEVEQRAKARQEMQMAAESAPAPAAAPAMAPSRMNDAPALPESVKIDRLIGYIGSLQGAVFIRNGKEYGPADAAQHLQHKREKVGDRIRTADDFIRLCASHSTVSGEAYLIRFADGRTRTAEDVLREELSRIETGR